MSTNNKHVIEHSNFNSSSNHVVLLMLSEIQKIDILYYN